jgi:hypothetical protein
MEKEKIMFYICGGAILLFSIVYLIYRQCSKKEKFEDVPSLTPKEYCYDPKNIESRCGNKYSRTVSCIETKSGLVTTNPDLCKKVKPELTADCVCDYEWSVTKDWEKVV